LRASVEQPHRPIRELRPEVSLGTAQLLDRCLAKKPEARYPDGPALLEALKACRFSLTKGQRGRGEGAAVRAVGVSLARKPAQGSLATPQPVPRDERPKVWVSLPEAKPWKGYAKVGAAALSLLLLVVGFVMSGKPQQPSRNREEAERKPLSGARGSDSGKPDQSSVENSQPEREAARLVAGQGLKKADQPVKPPAPPASFTPLPDLTENPQEKGIDAAPQPESKILKPKPPPVPPPGGVEAYAKKHGLKPALSLDLGQGVKMELVLIPDGNFMMGSPVTERGHGTDEMQHEVTISKAFYMGRYNVTQEQYERVMGTNPANYKGPNNPVEMVSWYDAQQFCKQLRARLPHTLTFPHRGKMEWTFQLPTEAQWEYACRAGTKTRFYSGDDDGDLDSVGWYRSNSDSKTHPAGEKKPNVWGLYDMHGNVWEWVQDYYSDKYYAESPQFDPEGPATGAARVLRGGGWNGDPDYCRAARRHGVCPPGSWHVDRGFRVALDF
ncbi:MAG: SUMF1/EgtB/PvdO family nonheme iron enzyme, partial [Planctomycetota bacterium]